MKPSCQQLRNCAIKCYHQHLWSRFKFYTKQLGSSPSTLVNRLEKPNNHSQKSMLRLNEAAVKEYCLRHVQFIDWACDRQTASMFIEVWIQALFKTTTKIQDLFKIVRTMYVLPIVGKHVWASHDWFWFTTHWLLNKYYVLINIFQTYRKVQWGKEKKKKTRNCFQHDR